MTKINIKLMRKLDDVRTVSAKKSKENSRLKVANKRMFRDNAKLRTRFETMAKESLTTASVENSGATSFAATVVDLNNMNKNELGQNIDYFSNASRSNGDLHKNDIEASTMAAEVNINPVSVLACSDTPYENVADSINEAANAAVEGAAGGEAELERVSSHPSTTPHSINAAQTIERLGEETLTRAEMPFQTRVRTAIEKIDRNFLIPSMPGLRRHVQSIDL